MAACLAPGTVREDERLTPFLLAYNLLYWPYLLASCVVLFVPAVLIFLLTLPFDPRRRLLHAYTCRWGAHYLALAPAAGVTVEGRDLAQAAGPCIFVSNHQSMVDVLAVFALRVPFLWVSKIENFRVPFLGWNMYLNRYVPLKRGHLPSILRMVRTCHVRLREGHSLYVFPEGTRSPTGELIGFFPGAFRMAVRFGVPIVPVVIEGTRAILPKGRAYIQPRRVLLRVLPPVTPAEAGNDPRRLLALVRERMERELARLRAA
ncbi:MAG: 1-acyl-sn-glycerol-3-phosphate acyltransferase [Deltaproteobacteria bacterium]|nr:1-acyl-sn-glycerol-3-phosphate acyltransferase [Deltaproteobacteria bacterium]